MMNKEKGFVLPLVLILLLLGTLLLIPSLELASSTLKSKQINTSILQEQYARDGAAEYAIWQLLYGDATTFLQNSGLCPNQICTYTVPLNNATAYVIIRMRTSLGLTQVGGAEGNRIKVTETVECEITPGSTAFDDDCQALPPSTTNMRARYTVRLEQISPDTSAGVVDVYNELGNGFSLVSGSVDSPDGSFPQILGLTPIIPPGPSGGGGGGDVWKWSLASPVYFTQGQVRKFRFEATINKNNANYCNRSYLKMTVAPPPYEHSGPVAKIRVGSAPVDGGCNNGSIKLTKYVNKLVAPPNQTTVFTYMINLENLSGNTLQVSRVKDVLPQEGFKYCSPAFPPADPLQSCDQAKYKITSTPFNPLTDSFTDTTGFTNLPDPTRSCLSGAPTPCPLSDRWQLIWTGANPWQSVAAAGQANDILWIRFQAQITPTQSGSYYNEFFVDIDTGCSAPQKLKPGYENVIADPEYCAAYSWPSGGTIVPMYDVMANAGTTTGQGNVSLTSGNASLESWYVVDNSEP